VEEPGISAHSPQVTATPSPRSARCSTMRAMRRTLLTVVLVLTACATNSSQGPTPHQATASESGSDPGVVCHDETPTGSSISRRVCRTPEEVDREHQEAQDMARSRGVAPPPPGSSPTGH